MNADVRARVNAGVQPIEGILVARDVARLVVHYLGQLVEFTVERYGCPPEGLAEVRAALAEAIVADARRRAPEASCGAHLLALGSVVDAATAAEAIGVTPGQLTRMCRAGDLEAVKRGRQWWPTAAAVQQEVLRRKEKGSL